MYDVCVHSVPHHKDENPMVARFFDVRERGKRLWRKEERGNIDKIRCKLCILPAIKRLCCYFTVVCFLCEVFCLGFFSKDKRDTVDTVVDLELGKGLECVQDS